MLADLPRATQLLAGLELPPAELTAQERHRLEWLELETDSTGETYRAQCDLSGALVSAGWNSRVGIDWQRVNDRIRIAALLVCSGSLMNHDDRAVVEAMWDRLTPERRLG